VSGSPRQARKKAQVSATREVRVACGTRPSDDRIPRKARTFNPTNPTDKVVVQFGRFDVGSQWCLSEVTPDEMRTLLGRIRNIETMTITEGVQQRRRTG